MSPPTPPASRRRSRGRTLDGADLHGADLHGANLDGAHLHGALWEQVAERLKASLIAMNDEGRHWIKNNLQGALEDGSLTYCSVGSIQAHSEGTVRALCVWLVEMTAGGRIESFNDHPDTTWDDVVAVFELAIKHARRFAK